MSTTPTPQSDQAATTPGRAEELAKFIERWGYGASKIFNDNFTEAAALLRAKNAELLALRAALQYYATPMNPATTSVALAALNSPTQGAK